MLCFGFIVVRRPSKLLSTSPHGLRFLLPRLIELGRVSVKVAHVARSLSSMANKKGKKLAAPKKASSKPAAKAKGKAIAKKPEGDATPKKGGKDTSTLPSMADTPASKRRRLERRHTEEQVNRVMKARFYDQGYEQDYVEALRNDKGETIREKLLEQIHDNRGTKTHISTAFWRQIFEEFPLKVGMFAKLPFPVGDLSKDAEDAVLIAQAENPALRSIDPWERYLERAPKDISEDEFLNLLHGAAEGPIVSRSQSHKMLISLLQFIGKHELRRTFKSVWAVISDGMDTHMCMHYKSWGMDEASFLGAHIDALSAIIPGDALASVMEARYSDGDIPLDKEQLKIVLQSKTGSAIFRTEAIETRYTEFLENRDDKLRDLLGNGFEASEVDSFKTLILQETQSLRLFGFKSYETKNADFNFMKRTVRVSVGLWQTSGNGHF